MRNVKSSFVLRYGPLAPVMAALLFIGCQSGKAQDTTKPDQAVKTPIRINAGATQKFTDSEGNVWLPDQGFTDGETWDRGRISIANTKNEMIYRTEHYSMTEFSLPVANGKYTVKLHFAETYEEIDGAGQRVFSFKVQGHEFKDFDVFVKAGGVRKAYVETVNVEVTNGKLEITFTSQVQNPEINGIEIIPASAASSSP